MFEDYTTEEEKDYEDLHDEFNDSSFNQFYLDRILGWWEK